MRNHVKLRAFELADQLALAIYQSTGSFPRHEQFGICSQMRRASVSTACNIVEGCARNSERDYLHFLDMAFGSARELEYLVTLAAKLGYLDGAALQALDPKCVETAKVIGGLIRSLRKQPPSE